MPAKSEKQRKAAGAALAEKRGQKSAKGPAKRMAKSMSESELKKFASKGKK